MRIAEGAVGIQCQPAEARAGDRRGVDGQRVIGQVNIGVAIEEGMKEKAEEFRQQGAEIYREV